MKTCRECKIEKEDSDFTKDKNKCRGCVKIYDKKYREVNKIEIAITNKKYYEENKEEIKEYRKEYYQEYYQENKKELNTKRGKYQKEKREKDPIFKLRQDISNSINKELQNNGSSKDGISIMNYLPYTIEQLQTHLASQFSLPENLTSEGKIWMTSKNRGKYHLNKWNENDPSTWVWQLDHKEPQSDFNITSMDSQEFRDCWALTNLRPLSAKINQLDGATRIRHKKDNQ